MEYNLNGKDIVEAWGVDGIEQRTGGINKGDSDDS
jgi:hypothetical protein